MRNTATLHTPPRKKVRTVTISASHPTFTIAADFASENGVAAQGVPTIVAGISRALTLGFPPATAGIEGARVQVRSKLMEDARKALTQARRNLFLVESTGDAAAYKRAQAAVARRGLELKRATAVTIDAYGVALDEDNQPYVVESRYPALLEQHADRQILSPVIDITKQRERVAAAA